MRVLQCTLTGRRNFAPLAPENRRRSRGVGGGVGGFNNGAVGYVRWARVGFNNSAVGYGRWAVGAKGSRLVFITGGSQGRPWCFW